MPSSSFSLFYVAALTTSFFSLLSQRLDRTLPSTTHNKIVEGNFHHLYCIVHSLLREIPHLLRPFVLCMMVVVVWL